MADVEINEGLTVPSMPSAPSPELDVGSGTAKTITPSLTVMAMPSAPAYSLLLVYERYQTGNDSALAIGGDAWEAQTFAPAAGHTVNSLGGRFYRTGAPGTVTLELYSADDGEGADGGPTGAALGSATFDGDGLTTATTGQWVNPKMAAGVALTQDAPYAVVVKATTPAAAAADAWGTIGSTTYTSSSTVRTYGWRFQVSAAVSVTHLTVRAYYADTYTLHLWRSSDKSLLATKTVAGAAGAWVSVALDSPVALTAATDYVVSVNGPVTAGTRMARRAAPAAGEFNGLVSFVDGRYSAGANTYPEETTDTNAWGVCGFLFSSTAVSKVYWLTDASSPTYANGKRWYSTNSGTSYTGDATRDFIFEEGIIQLAAAPVNVSIAAPTATATAEGLVPTVASRVVAIIAAPTATAAAEGLIPTVTAEAATPVDVQAVTATATAEGLLPTILAQRAAVITAVPPPNAAAVALVPTVTAIRNAVVAPAAATATAEGLLPIVTANSNAVIAPSPATANADGLLPTVSTAKHATPEAPTATASAEALLPTITAKVNAAISAPAAEASATGLVPTVTALQVVSVTAPTATASAEGLIPTLTVIRNASITAPTAEATGQGLVPTVLAEDNVEIAATTATATAEALAPTVTAAVCAKVSPPAATATAAGLVPTVLIVRHARITAPTATATAAGVVPTVTAWRFIEAPTGVVVTSSAHTMATVTSAAPTIATITSTTHTAVTVTPPTTSATVTSKTPTKAVVKNG